MPINISNLASETNTGLRNSRQRVRDSDSDGPAPGFCDGVLGRDLEKGALAERVEGEERLVAVDDLELTPAHGRELPVDQDAPELGVRLRRVPDAGDEVVLELCLVGAVVGEPGSVAAVRGGVQLRRGDRSRTGVGAVVSPVAEVRAAGRRRDLPRPGDDAVFEDGALAVVALDAQPRVSRGRWHRRRACYGAGGRGRRICGEGRAAAGNVMGAFLGLLIRCWSSCDYGCEKKELKELHCQAVSPYNRYANRGTALYDQPGGVR